MKLTVKGIQGHWFHEGLVSLIRARTNWDEYKTKEFLLNNEVVHFNGINSQEAQEILERIEAAGFEIQIQKVGGDLNATIAIPQEREFELLKKELATISFRLKNLEELKGVPLKPSSIKDSVIYQDLIKDSIDYKERLKRMTMPQEARVKPVRVSIPSEEKERTTTESNIGKYWLSRIGIFTLILGVVLFISYSFQFIGAWGKVLTGVGIGALLVGFGSYLAQQEKYRKWAMAAIGGGWAILYFTVYAAYHIPVTKVITNPMVGFASLLAVVIGSVTQSLKFKSAVMVFFSYFLGYVAITMVEISFYTLAASFLLACSIVIVTRKMGWNWLALLGLAAVYLTHYAWVESTIYGSPNALWTDALILPWAGDEWRIYPLITGYRSILHQSFLVLYWLLFTAIGFFNNTKKSSDEALTFTLLLTNSFVFTASYIHHLHVYYPDFKYFFALVMGVIFLLLFGIGQKARRQLFADLYLAFSVTLFSLTIPMYFDGPWISYGWSAAAVILSWLGVRHDRTILRILSWVLAGTVALRLIGFDYLEREVLFNILMPVRSCLPIFIAAAVAYLTIFRIYSKSQLIKVTEKKVVENIFLIASSLTLGFGFLVGGFRPATSVLWVLEGALLMWLGIKYQRFSLRIVSALFLIFGAVRFISVDYDQNLINLFTLSKPALRIVFSGLSIFVILWIGDWLRRKVKTINPEGIIFSYGSTITGALLLLCYFYDKDLSSWISIIWGIWAFAFIIFGFYLKDKLYRWCGLGMFTMVLLRLFFHDFSKLETIYRIVSFIGLGVVFLAASFFYSYYSKILLTSKEE